MSLKVLANSQSEPRRIHYEVLGGSLAGLTGHFDFLSLSAQKTEVGIESQFQYDKLPIPQFFVEFGMEVAFQRLATSLRTYVEREYRKSKETK